MHDTECSQVDHIYIKTLLLLTENLSVELISIIIEDRKCELDFAETLRTEMIRTVLSKVKIYTVSTIKAGRLPMDILLNIKHTTSNRRAYIMLTSIEITSIFFEASKTLQMDGFNDVWIGKQTTYKGDIIPQQTMIFSALQRRQYYPVNDISEKTISKYTSYAAKHACSTYEDHNK